MIFAPNEEAAMTIARRLFSQSIARIEPLPIPPNQDNLKAWWREIKALNARRSREALGHGETPFSGKNSS